MAPPARARDALAVGLQDRQRRRLPTVPQPSRPIRTGRFTTRFLHTPETERGVQIYISRL